MTNIFRGFVLSNYICKMIKKDKWIQIRVAAKKRKDIGRYARKNETTVSKILESHIDNLLNSK